MKTNPYQSLQTLALTGLLAGAFVSACSADIIYQDTFARASAGPLNGTAPTVDNTGGDAVWIAGTGCSSDGTNAVINSNVAGEWPGKAHLPLDWYSTYPDPKAQVDVQFVQSGDWITFGFGDGDYYGYPGIAAFLQVYGNGDVNVCSGPGWAGDFIKASFPGAATAFGWNRLRIKYSNTLQTASFYVNGTLLTNIAVPDNSPLSGGHWNTGVGMSYNSGQNAYATNLLVTFGNENTFPPTISTQPQGETIFVGDPLRLSLQASGTLPLQYTWCKNGAPIPGPNANLFTISPAALSDSANYSVIINNAAGSITSSVVRVDVHLEAQLPLAQINFDDLTNNIYQTAYAFADGGANLPVVSADTPGTGVGGSTALRAVADASDFQNVSVTYAGFATAVGLALPVLKTANPAFYEAYGSARVENLLDGVTNAPGRLTLRFYIPNLTNAGNYIDVFDVTKGVTLTSNYQAVAFVLNTADFGGASGAANFALNLTNIVRTQFDFTVDNFYNDFVQGPNCVIVVDDLKLAARISPPITASLNAGQVVLHWDDPNVQLQGAVDVTGPYIVIPTTASPYPVPGASPYRFFRTVFQTVP